METTLRIVTAMLIVIGCISYAMTWHPEKGSDE